MYISNTANFFYMALFDANKSPVACLTWGDRNFGFFHPGPLAPDQLLQI